MSVHHFNGLSLLYVFLALIAIYAVMKIIIMTSDYLQQFTSGYEWAQEQLLKYGKTPRVLQMRSSNYDIDPRAEGVRAAINDCINHHGVMDDRR